MCPINILRMPDWQAQRFAAVDRGYCRAEEARRKQEEADAGVMR